MNLISEIKPEVGNAEGGADVARGENATALAERGFIGTAPFRRVGSGMGFFACDGGFLAADPNLETASSWSAGTPDAQ
ncbi:hypothetical protein M413DRAFT_447824 [Hebeloma cylindrosporum]|uniref:Uncharacterized protein n=1 Tax=Hebeloma cylindrosporum TaxID=76867 RepID=A0A0C3C3Z8_HEBCY|nr:hypothetical protein M413DRAFT_447824 [Hebeloma cylindrosporum h7]